MDITSKLQQLLQFEKQLLCLTIKLFFMYLGSSRARNPYSWQWCKIHTVWLAIYMLKKAKSPVWLLKMEYSRRDKFIQSRSRRWHDIVYFLQLWVMSYIAQLNFTCKIFGVCMFDSMFAYLFPFCRWRSDDSCRARRSTVLPRARSSPHSPLLTGRSCQAGSASSSQIAVRTHIFTVWLFS